MAEPLGGLPIGPSGPGPTEMSQAGSISPKAPSVEGDSFVDLLKRSVNEVNSLQSTAANKVQKLVTGEISSIHEVMIAGEEASVAFSLIMQIRNQLVKAWDEIKRTPV